MKNLKIITKIVIVFLVVFVAFLIFVINGANTSNEIFNTMNDFYEHPYTVTNAAKDIKINMLSIHTLLNELIIDDRESNIISKNLLIIGYEQDTLDKIRLIEKRFSGDKEKVRNLRESFNKSTAVHHDIIDTIMAGDIDSAKEMKETIGKDYEIINNDQIDELLLVAAYIADDYINQSVDVYQIQRRRILLYGIASITILMVAGWLLSFSINKPMHRLVRAIEDSKDPEIEIDLDTDRKDEIGGMSLAFSEMVDYARKQQKIELDILYDNFRKLFSNIHMGTTLNSILRDYNDNIVDYNIIEKNKSFEAMINTINGNNDGNHKNIFLEIIKNVSNQNKSFSVEVNLESPKINLHITAFPLQKDQVIMLFEDITEKMQIEQTKNELENAYRNQQKLDSIGTLAGGVAHEINNPINGILNYGQIVMDSSNKDTVAHEYAQEIVNESMRIATIVRDLLQFSRHEPQTYEIVEIDALLNHTLSLIRTIIKRDQIKLIIDIDKNCPHIKCRMQQIQQVILNLLTNARSTLNDKYPKYNENKIIRIECNMIEIETKKWFRLTVEDHGNGITDSVMAKMFDPFFSTKGRSEGTGLGLSISYNIIKEHNGKLYCESKLGKYTKFYLELPYDSNQ